MADLLRSLRDNLTKHASRRRNRPFLQATMAAAALVSEADGTVTFSERHRIDEVVAQLEDLNIFDVHEAVDLLNEYLDSLSDGGEAAKTRLLDIVRTANGDDEAARLLVRISIGISHADDEFHPIEKQRVEEICSVLGLSPAEFEL